MENAAKEISNWFDRSKPDFSIPETVADAPRIFREHVRPLFALLAPFQFSGPLVLVPDTNVFLRNQELTSWGKALGTDEFTVLLVPGVLAELDEQ